MYVFTFVTSPAPTSGRRRRWAVPALALAAALAVGACGPGGGASGGHGGNGHDDKVPVSVLPSKPSKPMSVQQIAKALGCVPQIPSGKFRDYRQATCEFGGAKYILLDFDTDEGTREWTDGSKSYGGYYLVGTRWVVSGNSLQEISPLQETLGGKIEEGENHGPPPPSSQPGK